MIGVSDNSTNRCIQLHSCNFEYVISYTLNGNTFVPLGRIIQARELNYVVTNVMTYTTHQTPMAS